MKFAIAYGAALAVLAALISPSAAQERRTVSEQDVVTQETIPAPEAGLAIILKFGESAQVYFKHPYKVVRLADPLAVSATPMTDHIISFTGLAPGATRVTLEDDKGNRTDYSLVTVVRSVHEVKIYAPASRNNGLNLTNSTVNVMGNLATARESEQADYASSLCNEIGCTPIPKSK